MNLLSGFANMPAPVKVIVLIGSGAGLGTIVMSVLSGGIYTLFAIAVGAVVAALVIWRLIIHLRGKMKAGSFALGLSRAGGKGVADPALKARMDDLRKKFEDGVETFKKNGKDLYSLPWYMIVGPSGAGKTEAIRHSNIGFPPGLQDFLQGTGGTLSMNWWFTNHAVIIDTAGRMFMEEGEGTEWKEFLKLLRRDRPTCPINGLLLVISVENLLKDSTEKIEQTAGVIARQLDVIQRTLDVRFPVTAIVTKCDKITGFRDFFEMLNDPAQQHQILGWSNPGSLDEGFKAEAVSQHLDTVRQKLLKRRMGLMQNPVHTEDPTARRTDQIDEMFELPNNLVRIAPRLKSYLEKIFVAGEWSPKPLFLRGIYFTSSMREGQALDMALAQSLGVDVESIPGAKEYPKEKAYFLRDVFMAKVFREKGLVTRATNVSKAMAKQRAMLAFGSLVAVLVVAALVAFTFVQFNGTIGAPSAFWRSVNQWDNTAQADPTTGAKPWSLTTSSAEGWKYNGGFESSPGVSQAATLIAGSPASLPDLLALTAESSAKGIKPPLLAKLGVPEGDIEDGMLSAHRSLVDRYVLRPLLDDARFRLSEAPKESAKEAGVVWDASAVAALAELIRVQTYTLGKTPASASRSLPTSVPTSAAAAGDLARTAINTPDLGNVPDGGVRLAPLFTTLLGADEVRRLSTQIASMQKAVDHAVTNGSFAEEARKDRLAITTGDKPGQLATAAGSMVASLLKTNPAGLRMSLVENVVNSLEEFQAAEKTLQDLRFVGSSAGAAGAAPARETPATLVQYREVFEGEGAFVQAFKALDAAKDKVNAAVEEMNRQGITDPAKAFEDSEKELAQFVKDSFDLLQAQLPATGSLLEQAAAAGGASVPGAVGGAIAAAASDEPAPIAQLRAQLIQQRTSAEQLVGTRLASLREKVTRSLPLLASGAIGSEPAEAAYLVRHRMFSLANGLVTFASQRVAEETADGGSRVNPGARLEAAQRRVDGSRIAIEKTANWRIVPTDRWVASAAPLEQARAASAASATRVIELASMKAKHEAVLAELSAEWLKSVDGIKAAVANDAADDELRRLGEEGDDRKLWDSTFWRQPRLAFTSLDGTEYDPQFHPGAAKRLLSAVGAIRREVEGEGESRAAAASSTILEPRAIRSDRTYIQATDFARTYAEAYVGEWKRLATESEPSVSAWTDLDKGLKATDAESINKALATLRDQAREAIRVVDIPALRLSPDLRTSALSAIDAEFVDVEPQAGRQIISNWKTISAQDPAKAADRLRIVIEQKTKLDTWLRKIGPDDSYWNKLQIAMLGAVVGEADKDMKEARTTLLRTAKAAPLVRGPGVTGDLTPEQIASVAQALAKMGVKAGGSQADAAAAVAEVPDIFQPDALTLFGGDWSSDPARARWLEKLKYAVGVVNSGEMVLTIEHPGAEVTANMEPPDNRKYAAIKIGGQFAKAKDGSDLVYYSIIERPEKVNVRLPATGPVEVLYFRGDPKGNMQAPDGQLSLTGPWPFLKEALAGPSVKSAVAPSGVVVQVGQFPLRIVLPAGVDLDKWPTTSEWPER